MKRKIMRQGLSAFSITVPESWIRDNNLKVGDEIELKIRDRDIVLSPYPTGDVLPFQKEIDAAGQDITTLLKDVIRYYRLGYRKIIIFDYREVPIYFNNDYSCSIEKYIEREIIDQMDIVKILNSFVEKMFNMEPSVVDDNRYEIRRAGLLDEEAFDEKQNEILKMISESIENMGSRDNLKRFYNICRNVDSSLRLLNTVGYRSDRITNMLHTAVYIFERICMDLKEINTFLYEQEIDVSDCFIEEMQDMVQEQCGRINDYFINNKNISSDFFTAAKIYEDELKKEKSLNKHNIYIMERYKKVLGFMEDLVELKLNIKAIS